VRAFVYRVCVVVAAVAVEVISVMTGGNTTVLSQWTVVFLAKTRGILEKLQSLYIALEISVHSKGNWEVSLTKLAIISFPLRDLVTSTFEV
jgi:hypothetical protein